MMTPDERTYYVSHSPESDPGARARVLDALPSDPARLVTAVSGVILHRGFVAPLGITPHPESVDDVESRTIPTIIARIVSRDPSPLDVARAPERRFIGICRDYTLLAVAALRHHGVPARARVGFANYFTPGFHEDHWVCEYHADGRWRLLDAELGARVRRHFGVMFSPIDVPRDRFVTAGDAWRLVRGGTLEASTCGVSVSGIAGIGFVAGSVVRDLGAVNKREMLAWDYWGITREYRPNQPVPESVAARLDAVAPLTADPGAAWKALRRVYDDDAFRVPPIVLSFLNGRPTEVGV
jgi:hypothetical protein